MTSTESQENQSQSRSPACSVNDTITFGHLSCLWDVSDSAAWASYMHAPSVGHFCWSWRSYLWVCCHCRCFFSHFSFGQFLRLLEASAQRKSLSTFRIQKSSPLPQCHSKSAASRCSGEDTLRRKKKLCSWWKWLSHGDEFFEKLEWEDFNGRALSHQYQRVRAEGGSSREWKASYVLSNVPFDIEWPKNSVMQFAFTLSCLTGLLTQTSNTPRVRDTCINICILQLHFLYLYLRMLNH